MLRQACLVQADARAVNLLARADGQAAPHARADQEVASSTLDGRTVSNDAARRANGFTANERSSDAARARSAGRKRGNRSSTCHMRKV